MPKRGIVLSPDVGLDFGLGPLVFGSVGPRDLRGVVRYWDLICIPALVANSRELGISSPVKQTFFADEDLELLNKASILTCFRMDCGTIKDLEFQQCNDLVTKLTPELGLYALHAIQANAVKQLNQTTRHIWVMGRLGSIPVRETDDVAWQYSPVIELLRCLPSPHPETPLEEILEFKSAREYELMCFRTALDALVRAVAEAENTHTAIKLAEEEIEKALVGLHRVLDERRIQKVIRKLSVWLNLKDSPALTVLFAALGVGGADVLTIPRELGALAGFGINALIGVFARKVPAIDGLPAGLQDYFYPYEAEKLQHG